MDIRIIAGICELIVSLNLSFIFFKYLDAFFKKNKRFSNEKISFILVLIINTVISFLTTYANFPSVINGFLSFGGWIVFTIFYIGKFYMKILFMVLFGAILATLELLSKITLKNMGLIYFINGSSEVIAVAVLTIIFVCFKYFIRRRIGSQQNRYLYGLIVFPILNLGILTSFAFVDESNKGLLTYIVCLVVLVQILTVFYIIHEVDMITNYNLQGKKIENQLSKIKKQNINLKKDYSIIFNLIHSENKFILEIKNRLNPSEKDEAWLEDRLVKVNGILIKLEKDTPLLGMEKIQEYFIDRAKKEGIQVVSNNNVIKKQNNSIDILWICLILWENAIKESKISEKKFIGSSYTESSKGIIFNLVNSFVPKPNMTNYSLSNLEKYGIELKQINDLVDNLEGTFNVSVEDDFFKSEVIIPVWNS